MLRGFSDDCCYFGEMKEMFFLVQNKAKDEEQKGDSGFLVSVVFSVVCYC